MTPNDRSAAERVRYELERFARIIEGRGEALLVAPHGMTSNGPRRAIEEDLPKALVAARREGAQSAADMARWIESHYIGSKDHACAECVPGGDMVIEGFQCAPHIARALLASDASVPEPPTEAGGEG